MPADRHAPAHLLPACLVLDFLERGAELVRHRAARRDGVGARAQRHVDKALVAASHRLDEADRGSDDTAFRAWLEADLVQGTGWLDNQRTRLGMVGFALHGEGAMPVRNPQELHVVGMHMGMNNPIMAHGPLANRLDMKRIEILVALLVAIEEEAWNGAFGLLAHCFARSSPAFVPLSRLVMNCPIKNRSCPLAAGLRMGRYLAHERRGGGADDAA